MAMSNVQALPTTPPSQPSKEEIEAAIARGVACYFADCRSRIGAFVDQQFRYPGAWHNNRLAFGWDVLRAPLNLLWAPVYALNALCQWICGKLAWWRAGALLDKVPSGWTTRVQQNLSQVVQQDLLKINSDGHLLEDMIIAELQSVYERHNRQAVDDQQFHRSLEPLVEEALVQYQVTRTASADIANTLSCTLLGAFAFKKFTPGGIGIAVVLAYQWAQANASKQFLLGESLGRVWYGWFPPVPSVAQTASMVLVVLMLLAALAAFSGVFTDPIQAHLGLHRRRLHKMLNHLETDLQRKTRSQFRPKDQFVARVLETFDMLKSSLL